MQPIPEEKAQSVLIDMLIGVTLFLLVIAAGLTILDNQINAVSEQEMLLQQQKTADTTLNQLVSGTGQTTAGNINWETTVNSNCTDLNSVKFIGLAITDRVILNEKINKFKACSTEQYSETSGKILIGNDYYFRLVDAETGTVMKGCPDSSGNCEAGKTADALEGPPYLKKIETVTTAKRVVAFYDNENKEWVSAIAEIYVFKTR